MTGSLLTFIPTLAAFSASAPSDGAPLTSVDIAIKVGKLVVLFFLSSFFSGAETAMFSLSRTQVKRMANGTPGERGVTKLLEDPQRLLSTILLGNMLVNVMISSTIAGLASHFLGSKSLGVAIGASTMMLLIFGEITPKTIAVHHAQTIVPYISLPLLFINKILTPVRIVIVAIANLLMKLLGQKAPSGWNMVTREEISNMLAAGTRAGAATHREKELAEHILNLSNIEAHDIMIPRTEVDGVEDSLTLREAFVFARSKKRSRLPVYTENLDEIWGILSVVDMPKWRNSTFMDLPLSTFRPGRESTSQTTPSPIYGAFVIPENAKVEGLLSKMREKQAQMATIVDEYGGTAGILTMRDILSEIVGQISPIEEKESMHYDEKKACYIVEGKMPLRILNKDLGLTLSQEEADTIGGYIMEHLGRLPRAGDTIEQDSCKIRVVRMAGRRVDIAGLHPVNNSSEAAG